MIWIQEYKHLASDQRGNVVEGGKEPAVWSQVVVPGDKSAPFRGSFIRVFTDADVHLNFSGPATDESFPLPAMGIAWFGVDQGGVVHTRGVE